MLISFPQTHFQVSYVRTQWAAAAAGHRKGLVKEWALPLIIPGLWVIPSICFNWLLPFCTFLTRFGLFLIPEDGIHERNVTCTDRPFYLSDSDFVLLSLWTEVTPLLPPMCVSTCLWCQERSVCSSQTVMWILLTSIPLFSILRMVCTYLVSFWRDRTLGSTDFINETCLEMWCSWSQHGFMEKCPLICSYSTPSGWMYKLQMCFHFLGSPCGCSL